MSVLNYFNYNGKKVMETYSLSSIPKNPNTIKQHKCKSCNENFNNKKELLEHNEKTCYLLSNIKNNENNIIDIKELYNIVKILTDRVFELETELSTLKTNGTVKKKNILEWLNEKIKPEKTYLEWINNIQIKREYLELILETSLSNAFLALLIDYKKNNIIPLRFFTNKQKIYIYSQNNSQEFPKWNDNMTEEEFNKFIDIICNKFLKEFVNWTNENKNLIKIHQKIEEDYILYTNKIFRTKTMNIHIYSVIKKFLTYKIGEI